MTNRLGIYLHIPFCSKKCAYCDFYSVFFNEDLINKYTAALIKSIQQWGGKTNRPIDTVYLGGGTPSLLGERLKSVCDAIFENFRVNPNAEITLEINPCGNIEQIFKCAKAAGINRISIGAQSGNDNELALLGRTHTRNDTQFAVDAARRAGFENISLDLMLGLADSNIQTLKKSLDFITDLAPQHISAYILKIEENTAFYKTAQTLDLPDDDQTAEQYLFMCEYLENKGYSHYEISNFSKEGFESRHNLLYWECEEYIGIGAAAHSFFEGKRFYYPRDINAFILGNPPTDDGTGGNLPEKIMLGLRLKKGIELSGNLPESFLKKCKFFTETPLAKISNGRFFLTNSGMLVSNSILTELLECF